MKRKIHPIWQVLIISVSTWQVFLGLQKWLSLQKIARETQKLQLINEKLTKELAKENKTFLILEQYGIEKFESEAGRFLLLPPKLAKQANAICEGQPCLKIE